MSAHATREQLAALREGRTGGAAARELLNHVASCPACQRAAQETLDLAADARALARALASPPPRRRNWRPLRWAVVAAVAASVVVVPLLLRRQEPVTPPPVASTDVSTQGRPPEVATAPRPADPPLRPARWEALVREATSAGALQMPAVLLALQAPHDPFRAGGPERVEVPDMSPFAEVVESDRPQFRWPAPAGATSTVIVGQHGSIVAQSPPLEASRWTCAVRLARGRTYTWQVEIRRGEQTEMLPMPPAPLARFSVLDAAAKAELDRARAATPRDPLLLGILYARAGLRADALRELNAATKAGVPGAAALLASVRNWPRTGR